MESTGSYSASVRVFGAESGEARIGLTPLSNRPEQPSSQKDLPSIGTSPSAIRRAVYRLSSESTGRRPADFLACRYGVVVGHDDPLGCGDRRWCRRLRTKADEGPKTARSRCMRLKGFHA